MSTTAVLSAGVQPATFAVVTGSSSAWLSSGIRASAAIARTASFGPQAVSPYAPSSGFVAPMLIATVVQATTINGVSYKVGDAITDPVAVAYIQATPLLARNVVVSALTDATSVSLTGTTGPVTTVQAATITEAIQGANASHFMTPVATAAAIDARSVTVASLAAEVARAQAAEAALQQASFINALIFG